jgi:hypothetical protein
VSYVVKRAAPTELLDAIYRAARDQSSLPSALIADLVGDVSRDELERPHSPGGALQRA